MFCYLPLSVSFLYLVRVFTEPFRRDLNEAKAVYISLLALCNYDAPITSQVSSNVVNY